MSTIQSSTQTMSAGNMPGGGAVKKMSESSMKKAVPVHKLYTTVGNNETGEVDAAKAAALKAKSNRPTALKRTSKNRLTKSELEAIKNKRKEAAAKYAERSMQVKKDKVYRKNAVSRDAQRQEKLSVAQKRPERKMNNCEIMYSVGPDPKFACKSEKFRAFRTYARTQIKFAVQPKKEEHVSFMYKVGSPVKAVPAQ